MQSALIMDNESSIDSDGNWFKENCELWPDYPTHLELDRVVHSERSKFQAILVVDTKHHGRALILDGLIQFTERDEFPYQEMISFLPLCSHANPKRVLIIGGGDGGVAREVSKLPHVSTIDQVEIDERVVQVSKEYLPFMAEGFKSPKLRLMIGDGVAFLKNNTKRYDVIITDSSDPIGPAVNLFDDNYYGLLKRSLHPNGIICSQVGCQWSGLDMVAESVQHCAKHFKQVKVAYASVPTYPAGQICFLIATNTKSYPLIFPQIILSEDQLKLYNLRYYNSDLHTSAFCLPNFVTRAFELQLKLK